MTRAGRGLLGPARRRGGVARRVGAVVAVLVTALAGGCGIPDNTEVRPLRPGPSTGTTSGGEANSSQSKREDTTDPGQFVKNYLAVAAGDFDSSADRAKEFLSPGAEATFKPQADTVKVVRLAEDPLVDPVSPRVRVQVREVGTLRAKGILDPASDNRLIPYEFDISSVPGRSGLFVTKAPQVLLLTDTALEQFYSPRTIYFWNQDRTGLIPDVRYLSQSVPLEQQPTQILDWLTSGPSPWLSSVAEPLPGGTKPIGNVPAVTNETLTINLSSQALPQDDQVAALDRLQKQLRWSLRPNLPGTLELSIDHSATDQRYTDSDFLSANAAFRQIAEPERFVVYNGQIRRLAKSYNAALPVPLVRPEDNKNVRMAALSVSGARGYAALVVNESNGGQALRVGAAGAGDFAALRRIKLNAPIGRPVWAKSAVGADGGTAGLVTAAGHLYSFRSDGKSISEVQWQGGTRPASITAVSVAPDAHRAAVIAGGRLYVAALARTDDGMQLNQPHVVGTELRSLTTVDWTSEGQLVVAGLRSDSELNRYAIWETSLDGAEQTERLRDLGEKPVSYLTAMPASPTRTDAIAGAVTYVVAGSAFDDSRTGRIAVTDLAQPVTDPPPSELPGAPFFLL